MNYYCYVMFNKRAGVFYLGIKPQLQKHFAKSVYLGSPNKGSNCEGIILAYKKNKLCLISILYINNVNEECSSGIKLMHVTF